MVHPPDQSALVGGELAAVTTVGGDLEALGLDGTVRLGGHDGHESQPGHRHGEPRHGTLVGALGVDDARVRTDTTTTVVATLCLLLAASHLVLLFGARRDLGRSLAVTSLAGDGTGLVGHGTTFQVRHERIS